MSKINGTVGCNLGPDGDIREYESEAIGIRVGLSAIRFFGESF